MARKKKILLYEDFVSIRDVLVKTIQRRDCELVVCDSLQKALAQLNGISLDLVVCDNDCKENGAQVLLKTLRDNTSYLFTPIVLLISGNKENLQQNYKDYNIAGFLNKPFDMNHFNKILERFI